MENRHLGPGVRSHIRGSLLGIFLHLVSCVFGILRMHFLTSLAETTLSV